MRKIGFQILFVGWILILISACDKNKVYEAYKKIPQSGWQKDSLVVFNVPISDTVQNNNLFINVRNKINYKYSNLWLFVEIEQPGGIAVTDTFELSLASPSGKWLGEGFGGIKTRQVMYRSGVYFPVSGDYKINIKHGMREETLEGISDIGFRVEQVSSR